MRVHGELLSAEGRKQTMSHFCKNDGLKWDLHEISLYVQQGYAAVEADKEASEQIRQGMESLRQRKLQSFVE